MEGAVGYPRCVGGCPQTHISSVTACIAVRHLTCGLPLCDPWDARCCTRGGSRGCAGARRTHSLHCGHSRFPPTHTRPGPTKLPRAITPQPLRQGHSPSPSPPLLPLPGAGRPNSPAGGAGWGFPRPVLLLPALRLLWVTTPQDAEAGLGGSGPPGIPAKDPSQAQKVQRSPLPPRSLWKSGLLLCAWLLGSGEHKGCKVPTAASRPQGGFGGSCSCPLISAL